ncbi:4774_t:CDS:2 [Acaulospora morrowiae]|uniref:4774_t:CDS:1 n=1 Tax=Acaulospora morrowiae TaxID=94023 RepID=A0A9N8V4E2_9GLOM|nr:4774_t:CDS:2 [Acaulospora morrowiae]
MVPGHLVIWLSTIALCYYHMQNLVERQAKTGLPEISNSGIYQNNKRIERITPPHLQAIIISNPCILYMMFQLSTIRARFPNRKGTEGDKKNLRIQDVSRCTIDHNIIKADKWIIQVAGRRGVWGVARNVDRSFTCPNKKNDGGTGV